MMRFISIHYEVLIICAILALFTILIINKVTTVPTETIAYKEILAIADECVIIEPSSTNIAKRICEAKLQMKVDAYLTRYH